MDMIKRFFLENKESIEELVKTFTLFSSFSGLKPNISKCEICWLGPLKGMEMTDCRESIIPELQNRVTKPSHTLWCYKPSY